MHSIHRFRLMAMLLALGALVASACGAAAPTTATAAPTAATAQTAAAAAKTEEPTQVINVGALYPLTGQLAAFGDEYKRGIDLKLDEINAGLAKDKLKLQMFYEDSQGNANVGLPGFTKLVTVNKTPVVLIAGGSPVVLVTLPAAEEQGVLVMQTGANSPKLVGASKNLINVAPTGTIEAQTMLAYANKQMGAKKLALIAIKNDFGVPLADFSSTYWKSTGAEVVAYEQYEATAADFGSLVAKVRTAKPDAIYLATAGTTVPILIKQIREAGITAPMLSHTGVETRDLIEVGGAANKDLYWTSIHFDPADPESAPFVNAYKAKYQRDPLIGAAVQVDALAVIAQAAQSLKKQGKALSGVNLRDEMLKVKTYGGYTGKMTFPADGNTIRPLDIRTVKDGTSLVQFKSAAQLIQMGVLKFE